MSQAPEKSNREFFRVIIPDPEFVYLQFEQTQFRVREISEEGIRFESDTGFSYENWLPAFLVVDPTERWPLSIQLLRQERVTEGNSSCGSAYEVVVRVANLPLSHVVALQSKYLRTYAGMVVDSQEQKSKVAESPV